MPSSTPPPTSLVRLQRETQRPKWRLELLTPNPTALRPAGSSLQGQVCDPAQQNSSSEDQGRSLACTKSTDDRVVQSISFSSVGNRTKLSFYFFIFFFFFDIRLIVFYFQVYCFVSFSHFLDQASLSFFLFEIRLTIFCLSFCFFVPFYFSFLGSDLFFFFFFFQGCLNKQIIAHLVKAPNTPQHGGTLQRTDLWERATDIKQESADNIHQKHFLNHQALDSV